MTSERTDDVESLALGQAIRTIRSQRGLTLQALAERIDVSQSLISQVERGLAAPSITTLRRIAAALGVPVASLFAEGTQSSANAGSDTSGRQLVVKRETRKHLRVPPSHVVYELLTPDLNREIEFIWIEYAPGSVASPEPMSHAGEENAICIEGEAVVTIEGQEFVLQAGDSISFDCGRPHQVENRGSERAVLISAITPPTF